MRKNLTSTGKVLLIALLTIFVYSESVARVYYSRQSGLWNQASTWSTEGFGDPTNAGTFPGRGDIVLIGDGHSVEMNVNATVSSVTIGQGSSGTLMYSGYLTFQLTVAGNMGINPGGTLSYTANNGRMHNLYISGNLVNNGTVDLYVDANDYVNITFNSRSHSVVSGTGSWDLNRVNVFKSTETTWKVEATSLTFENAIRELVVSFGTFVHNNTGTYTVNPTLGDFTISSNAVIEVLNGTMHLSPTSDNVYLEGQLKVTGGTMLAGSTAGNKGIRYDQNGTVIPSIDVTGGTLQVYGGITNKTGSSSDPFRYSQSSGHVDLNTGTNGTTDEVFQVNNNASSRFTMSDGIITLQNPNAGGGSVSDFSLCGSAGTVLSTGGTIEFGNASTGSGAVFTFVPYPGIVMPNIHVTGSVAASVTLRPSAGSTVDYSFISLQIDAGKTFDNRSVSGAAGDSKVMTLTGNFDGLHAFYCDGNFSARTGTVLFQGTEGLWVGGTVNPVFYNLSVNNPLGISLSSTVLVSNNLMLSDGVVYSSAVNPVVCLAGASANIGSSLSYVDGPMQQVVASASPQTLNLPIGKNGAYRPVILAVQHTSATPVTYTSELNNISARAMGYSVPASLTWVSDVRHYNISRTAVGNLANARITLVYGADDVVTDPSNLRVARDNGSAAWLDMGGTGTAAGAGSITSSNFNTFNTVFTLANGAGGSNPLPVDFVSFDAQRRKQDVQLSWSTASEINSDYFEVERSSDGIHFRPLSKVAAMGNSNTLVNYTWIDRTPANGINYYRLRQWDLNGASEYTSVRSVFFSRQTVQVYPNPSTQRTLTASLNGWIGGEVTAALFNMSGKQCASMAVLQFGEEQCTIQLPAETPCGTYLLVLTDTSGQSWNERIVLVD